MMKMQVTKRLLSLLLVIALMAGIAIPASATSTGGSLSFTRVDSSDVPQSLLPDATRDELDIPEYADTDMVRVSIILDRASTVEMGYSTYGIAQNAEAMHYRKQLREEQISTTAKIERATGETLDVVWNLTLAANLISANVPYGQIDEIEQVPGVQQVVLETRYEPAVYSTDEPNDPQMATSFEMIGSAAAWASGYTGAGSRVAVIDTGIDTDHQSFSDAAFQYSLAYQAGLAEMETAAYIESLDLLDAEEIAAVAGELNVPAVFEAGELYVNSKIPFGFNYVDSDVDITHDNDSEGEHGSHVESIAAANAFIPNADGTFSRALETVKVQGVAPDAQIIAMKVFGKQGGAYDSDYMAAIEDAIVLGCDAVNLSLGTSNAGFSRSMAFQEIMDRIVESDTLVTVSMGNTGAWADYAVSGVPYLYGDDVNFATGGSPASYTNGLSVASVDNGGYTGQYITVGEDLIFYTEAPDYGNAAITTLAGAQEYILIDGIGTEEEWAALADVLAGKIAVCSRGTTSFFEKANAAVENGAIATIIYNNEPGELVMDLTGYYYSAPCIAVTLEEGKMLRNGATAVTAEDGTTLYYTGTLTVAEAGEIESIYRDPAYFTMSAFSSWGVAGTLELKPEITAPGGSIYGVNGQDPSGTAYETMSGTSMAAPQVAGMAALVAQYIRENGLEEKTGLSVRHLTQSLLMSTSIPLREEANDGYYWSVLKQGAGLADVGAALSAKSYIQMADNATDSAADYKVKAELGHDPERSGSYTFDFTIHNFSDETRSYTLSSDIFTQDLFEQDGELYLDTQTIALAARVSYAVDGVTFVPISGMDCDLDQDGDTDTDDAQLILEHAVGNLDSLAERADVDGDGHITTYDAHLILSTLETRSFDVAAGAAVTVQVNVVLPEALRASLDQRYVNGAYLEGFVFVKPVAAADGAVDDATHSIPILGFYGDWSDPSMYDQVSVTEYMYGETTIPYVAYTNNLVVKYPGDPNPYYHIGNPYIVEDSIPTERFAIRSADMIYGYESTLIRNAAALMTIVTDEDGNILYKTPVSTQVFAAYFDEMFGVWRNEYYASVINRSPAALGLGEGDSFTVTVIAVPEYYETAGNLTEEEVLALYREDRLGSGAYLSTTVMVDDIAPTVSSIDKDLFTGNLTVTASDNNYIAAIQVVNKAGSKLYGSVVPEAGERGQTTQTTIDLSGITIGPECYVVVADYADNHTVYEVAYGGEPEDYSGRMFGFTGAYARGSGPRWVELDPDELWYDRNAEIGGGMETAAAVDNYFTAAEYVDGRLFVAATDGYIYTTLHGEWAEYQKVGDFSGTVESIMDMALDHRDNTLYALGFDNVLYTVDMTTGALTKVASISVTHPDPYSYGPHDLQTLAIDDAGNFYTVNYGGSSSAYLYRFTLEDVVDGAITDLPAVNPESPLGVWSYSNESMAWDHDRDILYLASAWGTYPSMDIDNKLWIVDTQTGTATRSNETFCGENSDPNTTAGMLYDQVVGLYIVPAGSQIAAPTDTATGIALNRTEVTMLKGGKEVLVADVYPWTLTDKTVTWSTSDPNVATVVDGVVTARDVGTVTITATTNAEPRLRASCTVTIEAVPEIQLSGLIHDANGTPVWAEFTTSAPAEYTVMGEGAAYIAGGLLDDMIYVHDGSTMYGIDGDTFAASNYGAIAPVWAWSDAAPAPAGEDGLFDQLLAICNDGTYLEFIDPDAGSLTYWDQSSSFSTDPLAVLAHAGTGTYDYDLWFEYFPDCPANFYYTMTESGALWHLTVFTFNEGESYSVATKYIGETGISLDGVASKSSGFASLLYDEATGYLVLSRYNGGDTASLFAIDPARLLVADLGTFGNDIWPVVSLYQYERVTELTLRMSQEAASIYIGDEMQLSVQVKPSSFTGGVTWSSSNEAVATVDENGLVSTVAPGNAVITATSVDVNSAGEQVSVSCDVTVLPLLTLDASVGAQIETQDGLTWSTIDLSSREITDIAPATTKLAGAGYNNGKIYGSDGDYEHNCHYYMVDPANDYAETQGTESHADYTMLDGTNSPAIEVDLYGEVHPAFGDTLFLGAAGRLSMLNFEAGTALGWTISYYDVDDAAAIAFLGHTTAEGSAPTYHYAVLTCEGELHQISITPSYYDSWSERVEYSLSVSYMGNIGREFESPRTLSMTCVRNENGINGLVIADAWQSPVSLYYVDLTAETLTCGKIGNLEGVTHLSGLYGDLDTVTSISDSTVLDAARYTVRAATQETNSSPLALHQAPAFNQPSGAMDEIFQTTANPVGGSVNAALTTDRAAEIRTEDDVVTVTLTEDADVTNGLLTVSYDPAVLAYDGMTSSLSNTAVRVDEEAGTIVFAYAAATAVTAEAALAELRFLCTEADATVQVETEQRNEELNVCPSAAFTDLDVAEWYHEGVDFVLEHGLMVGMNDTTFAPKGNLTRAQLVTILYRMAGEPATEGMENPFTDVNENDWFANAVIWAYDAKVVEGMSDTTFAPNAAITREQIATILYRYTGAEPVEGDYLKDFTDGAEVSDYAEDALSWAVATGLITGMGNGKVAPRATATRAQIATILMRYCGK